MRVDTAMALRVFAHELRSPTGVAQGYVRMLVDGRLAAPSDRQHALEQIGDVLGRIGQLSRQASDAAAVLEHLDPRATELVAARAVVDQGVAIVQRTDEVVYEAGLLSDEATLRTPNRPALETAIASLVAATVRELPSESTHVQARVRIEARDIEVLAGRASHLSELAKGPDGPAATPLVVERGGLGLTLVIAALVLDAHHAITWTTGGNRGAFGLRLPLET